MNIGDTLKSYTIVDYIGAGANGEVWLAEKDGINYALKVLLSKGNQGIDKDKYDKEVNSWRKANGHQNILTIHENFIANGKFVIVMDYADGGSLKNKKFTSNEALHIIIKILNGLNHLHKLNIVHRDINPDNILLKFGNPCLGDFGLARDLSLTQSIAIGGSINYFSPELANAFIRHKGTDKLSYPRTLQDDLWATATTFYNLFTLDFPCGGLGNRTEREPLSEDFPKDLIDFFDKAFQKELLERFQSAEEMLQTLVEIRQRRFEKANEEIVRRQLESEYRQKYEKEIYNQKKLNEFLTREVAKLDEQAFSSRKRIENLEIEIGLKDRKILYLIDELNLLSSPNYSEKEMQKIEKKYRRHFEKEKQKIEAECRKQLESEYIKSHRENDDIYREIISDVEYQSDIAGEEFIKLLELIKKL